MRGACQTGRQRESCRCAGTHTQKKRRPDCPKRSICWGVKDCLHWEREMREIFKSERCQTHGGGAGEGDLIEPAWRSTGTAQQHPRLPHKVQRQRAKKSGLEGVGAGDSKNEGQTILFLGQSTHRQKADILSFPSRGRPPPNSYPITVFLSLGAKKKNRVLQRDCGTAYAVPRQGNQSVKRLYNGLRRDKFKRSAYPEPVAVSRRVMVIK